MTVTGCAAWRTSLPLLTSHPFSLTDTVSRSPGSSGKGKESEYENLESDREEAARPAERDSEQREIDEFEEEERKLLAEDAKVGYQL